jgi:ABC-type transport system involved in cytochrome bd biosynthesis fused ATPase/permease subunit
MINKRLVNTVPESKKYIAGNVVCQWVSLMANILLMASLAKMLATLSQGAPEAGLIFGVFGMAAGALLLRAVCTLLSARMSYLSSKAVKRTLREKIYRKLLSLGPSYQEQVNTSEVVQVAVEGVDQLETYFGSYLPQFFYAMLAPLTLFAVLGFVSLPAAVVLFLCVPLIPVSIVVVQRWAKKLLSKYWGQYTALGDTFLEDLQGLTTLKIYQADAFKQRQMNQQAERFRKITMKVLTMQLNSITIMDLVAYGGAALGIILGVGQFQAGHIDLYGCLLIIILAADFFLPMRLLGSFFHIAMNGMAASEKIFRLLDLPVSLPGEISVPDDCSIRFEKVGFRYEKGREVLRRVSLECPEGSFTALVGESGCGKSTLASLLIGRNRDYSGSITIGGVELSQLNERSLLEHVTYISHQSHIFKGTVEENLRMAQPSATEEQLWQILEQVKLADFLRQEQGLATPLLENASNLSGGQRQRLALARGLLHNSPVYIFDEATSNIDVESENDIMEVIRHLAKEKTVLLISHRLANVVDASRIYVLDKGEVVESGKHQELLENGGLYCRLWDAQYALEHYGEEETA